MDKANNIDVGRMPHHGENIKRFRGLRGWKQEELAKELNRSEKWLGDLEKKPLVADETLQLIADKLQVHIDVLKKYTDECEVQINFNGDHVSGSGYQPTSYIDNDVEQIAAAMRPLYEEINAKNLEIYKLKEEIKRLKSD